MVGSHGLSCVQGASTQGVTAVLTQGSVPAYTVEVLSGPQAQEVDPLTASNNSGNSAAHPYNARISVLRELHTRKSDRSCLHVELDIQGSGLHYEAGDHVGMWKCFGLQSVVHVGLLNRQHCFLCIQAEHMLSLPNLDYTHCDVVQSQCLINTRQSTSDCLHTIDVHAWGWGGERKGGGAQNVSTRQAH